jgi:hypothetical protein
MEHVQYLGWKTNFVKVGPRPPGRGKIFTKKLYLDRGLPDKKLRLGEGETGASHRVALSTREETGEDLGDLLLEVRP